MNKANELRKRIATERELRLRGAEASVEYHRPRHPFDTAISLLRSEAEDATNLEWAADVRMAADWLEASKEDAK